MTVSGKIWWAHWQPLDMIAGVRSAVGAHAPCFFRPRNRLLVSRAIMLQASRWLLAGSQCQAHSFAPFFH